MDVARRRAAKRAVVQDGANPDDAALVLRLAKLTDDHGLDLQEIFLDAPTPPVLFVRMSGGGAQRWRTGLEKMLCCLAEVEFEDPGAVAKGRFA